MNTNFLLTYSVENIGRSYDQSKADEVRNDIHLLTLSKIIDLGENIHAPFHGWKKLESVETTIKGDIDIGGGLQSSKKEKAKQSIEKLFKKILKDQGARSDTTVIKCAILVSGTDDTIEFDVTY